VYLTAARDYGQLRPRRPSPFVMEALGPVARPAAVPEPPSAVLARYAPVDEPPRADAPIPLEQIITLSRQAVEDYLTCPLRYRYGYVLRVPVPTPPDAMYGAALHRAVAAYYQERLAGRAVTAADVQATFRAAWVAEGFMSAEHATAAFEQGLRTLEVFVARENASATLPEFVERPFSFMVGNDRVTGRWDRVDREDGGAVIIDFKSTDVSDEKTANERARGSQQLDIYALAYRRAFGELPKRVELHFLGSGLMGRAVKTEADLVRTRDRIADAGRGIRERRYEPKPTVASCGACAFRWICPAALIR
jgi:DNA helicase-2/ATP-dependent DNA helicase PcrA